MTISDVVSRFDSLEQSLKSVFPKVDPRTVVGLIILRRSKKDPLYTVETVIKPGQNTEDIRELIIKRNRNGSRLLPTWN